MSKTQNEPTAPEMPLAEFQTHSYTDDTISNEATPQTDETYRIVAESRIGQSRLAITPSAEELFAPFKTCRI